ncbi:lytic murein transglycosylase [Brevundimonas sp.]|jgi:membrane-bound lytic murein transglycosylase B|uniref:lytic murein transglycosylase n=1 Tax=Brevundimonas sp. TaxID=1871086 RepID=UPI002D1FB16A|nr:lytic murein transglycosylase [Brevundimonas sp.]
MRMTSRLILCLVVAACAPMAPDLPPISPTPTPTSPPQQPQRLPVTPVQPSTGEATPTEVMEFNTWRDSFLARRGGANREVWAYELAGLTPDHRVIDRDRSQPEFARGAGDYITRALTADRIQTGRDRIGSSPWMNAIQDQYGVPKSILVGIWAQESAFGRIQGDMDVIRSLATLAWEGRRREWAEGQLVNALTIVSEGRRDRARLTGSWAGAMGQTQFMPDNYLRLARDGDGDGRVDIWGSDVDALASAANLLANAGWRRNQRWALEVTLPSGFDYSLTDSAEQPWSYWRARGVDLVGGGDLTHAEAAENATILLPSGAGGPAFLALPNHYVIRRYNNAMSYALAIGLLADAMDGRPGVSRAWPSEPPLSREQRLALQRGLQALGYDPGGVDGIVGSGTRRALRQYQVARGLTADGYVNEAVINRIRSEAGV